jgi:hypothetical protein
MPSLLELPEIPDAERTPLIAQMVALIETLAEKTQLRFPRNFVFQG